MRFTVQELLSYDHTDAGEIRQFGCWQCEQVEVTNAYGLTTIRGIDSKGRPVGPWQVIDRLVRNDPPGLVIVTDREAGTSQHYPADY